MADTNCNHSRTAPCDGLSSAWAVTVMIFFLMTTLLIGRTAFSQNLPNGVTAPSSKTARALPWNLTASPTYQRVISPVMAVTDEQKVRFGAPADSMSIVTNYMDGLGRPLQTVMKQGTPQKKDFVIAATYDEFGRQSFSYLPYPSASNSGLLKTNPFYEDSAYYKGAFPNEQINYSQTMYDGSPLNRVTKSMAAGNAHTGAGVGTTYSTRANGTTDSVRLWTIADNSENDIPATNLYYAPGSLMVMESTNEEGIKTIVYKNEQGHTILTKQQVSSTPPAAAYTGWLCTYYIYNEMGLLRYIITPKGTQALAGLSWNLAGNPAIARNLCYAYFYDTRERVIYKSLPDKGKIYIAYDTHDRVVMAQDSLLRATAQWQYVKYDGQSRPVKSGLITMSGVSKDSVIARAARSNDYPTLTGTYSVLSEIYYDDYNWVSGSGSGLTGTLATGDINSTNFITTYNTAPEYAQPVTASKRIRGAVTGVKTAIIGTANYLYALNIYDNRGRVIQTQSTNYSGGKDTSTMQYSFTSQVLRSFVRHRKLSFNAQGHTLLTKYTYDAGGRLLTVHRQADGKATVQTNIQTYNELGQALTQALGASLESRTFTYNILGAPDGINKNYARALNDDNWFGEEINYDYGFSQNQLDGNIGGTQWRSKGDGKQRAYGYTYDAAGRLTKADFSQKDGSWGTGAGVDYTLSGLSYDANGNILSMTQKGLKINTSPVIDSLLYGYAANSNQLLYVTDKANDTTAHLGDFTEINNNTTQDYWYDGNGNYTKDNNKGISAVTYNFMNLPEQITVTNKGTISYVYDAAGNKLQKKITEGARIVTTTFISGYVYQNDTLQYALTGEGRVRYLPSSGGAGRGPVYDYFIKDHLGNVRMVLTDDKDTSFYPAATLESANIATERLLYSGLDSGRVSKSSVPGYPADGTTSPNDYIQQLSGSGYKIGSGILLKVMSGDKMNIRVSSWYKTNGATPGSPNSIATALVTNLINSLTGSSGPLHGSITSGQLTSSGVMPAAINSFLSNQPAPGPIKPKAYINWVLLDEQFKFVQSGSGAEQVPDEGVFGTPNNQVYKHVKNNLPVTKSGYLYVFVSNETPNINVFFDNLQVTHEKGPLLEESHYYPFGTEMKVISSHALPSYVPNRYKANAGAEYAEQEWANGSGLEMYETFYRSYDAQMGRFLQGDPKMEATVSMSGYVFSGNNPVMFTDLLGDQMDPRHYGSWPPPFYFRSNFFSYMDKNGNKWHHRDFMAGTGAEGIPYTEGWGSDGFGDMTTGGGGSHVSHISWGTNQGQEGYRVYWWEIGKPESGEWLEELKLSMTFKPFSFEMQWNRREYQNQNQTPQNTWIENTKTGLGAFDVSNGAKTELINYAAKSSKSLNNLKYVKVARDITRGVAYVQGALIIADVYKNSEIKASNILDAAITGVSSIPGWGWAIGGAYFLGDLITKEVTGQTIGQHLDNAVGGALLEW